MALSEGTPKCWQTCAKRTLGSLGWGGGWNTPDPGDQENHGNALSKDSEPKVLKMLPALGLGAVVRQQRGLQPSVRLQQSCA